MFKIVVEWRVDNNDRNAQGGTEMYSDVQKGEMMKSNKLSKLTVVLLTAAMVLAFMPAMTFSSHAASKKAKTSITRVAPTKAAKYTMTVGKSATFKAKAAPSKLQKKTVYASSSAKVLTINKKTGKASAKKAGTAKVTAKNGKMSVSWKVTVKKAQKTERADAAAKTLNTEMAQFQNKTPEQIAEMTPEDQAQLLKQYSAMLPVNITIDASVVKTLSKDQQAMLVKDLSVLSSYDVTVTPGTQKGNNATVNVKITTYKYSTVADTLLHNVTTDFGATNFIQLYKNPTDKELALKLAGVFIKDLNDQLPAITTSGRVTRTVTVPMEYSGGVWQTTKTTDFTNTTAVKKTGAFTLADAMTDGFCTTVANTVSKLAGLLK